MTWHLKDRELEKKIIAIDPEFLKRFHINQKILFTPLPPVEPSLSLTHEILTGALKYEFELRTKKGILGKLVFDEFELEDIPEYNPKIWNDSRKVTPPENVIFMAKVYRTSLREQTGVYYKALIYKDSKWYYVINGKPSGTQMYLYEDDYVEFKSWVDRNEG